MRSLPTGLLSALILAGLPACNLGDDPGRLDPDVSDAAEAPGCSIQSGMGMIPTFVNHTGKTISAWWIDFSCNQVYTFTLQPRRSEEQATYKSHVWRFREGDNDPTGKVVKEVVLDLDNGDIPLIGIP